MLLRLYWNQLVGAHLLWFRWCINLNFVSSTIYPFCRTGNPAQVNWKEGYPALVLPWRNKETRGLSYHVSTFKEEIPLILLWSQIGESLHWNYPMHNKKPCDGCEIPINLYLIRSYIHSFHLFLYIAQVSNENFQIYRFPTHPTPHKEQPRHEELHALLFSNSIRVL